MVNANKLTIDDERQALIKSNADKFDALLLRSAREGIETLISYLHDATDFYIAPASTRFHGNVPGGLCAHSLNVFDRLMQKYRDPFFRNAQPISANTLAIVALLHDVCKANFYTVEMRNKKTDEGKWTSVPFYAVDDEYPMGHGEKSLDIVRDFIKLDENEKMAIRWHMGFTEDQSQWSYIDRAMKKYPLVLALHEADIEASKFLDEEAED